jgi:anti-anti-sigma factor
MELKMLRQAPRGIERCEVVGHITNSHATDGFDPFAELFGPDVYRMPVMLSLEKAPSADSMGIQWLLTLNKRFAEGGGKLVLHSANPMTRQLLQIMRMDLVLTIVKDADAARALLEQHTSGGESDDGHHRN